MNKMKIRPRRGRSLHTADISKITGLGEVFKSLGSMIELAGEISEKGQEKIEKKTPIITPAGKAMYGFSINLGGKGLIVEQFGNRVHETEKGPVVEEVREPFVDIFEEKDKIEVITEIPGVNEKEISYEVKNDILILNTTGDRKYSKEILLPSTVSIEKTSYRNGVFRLFMKKINKN